MKYACGECGMQIAETSYGWTHQSRPPRPHQATLADRNDRSQPDLLERVFTQVRAAVKGCKHPTWAVAWLVERNRQGYICDICDRFWPAEATDSFGAWDDDTEYLTALLNNHGET